MIEDIGRHLYGAEWIGPMSRAIPCGRRKVARWLRGEREIPREVWLILYEGLRQHAVENASLSYMLSKRIFPDD
jgi:hypothetical protein